MYVGRYCNDAHDLEERALVMDGTAGGRAAENRI